MAPLVSTVELGDYLQRTVDADAAALAVAGASGVVRDYCGWSISEESGVTLTVDAALTRVLNLPTLRLTAVEEIRVDGEAIDPDDYKWRTNGQVYRHEPWPSWTRIEVDCDHGWNPIPDVVKIVTLSVAARHLTNPQQLRSDAVMSVQRTFANDLTTLDLALLGPYRLS